MPEHTVLAAFDRGQMPVVSLVNVAKAPLGMDFTKLAAALQTYVSSHFAKIWGLPCKVQVAPSGAVPPGTWALVFADDATQAGILGYHELTPDGLPISYVFVKTSALAGESISVTASHELAEMLLNPACNRWVQDHRGIFWAMEASDQVEDSTFLIDGFEMSNFLYPAAWEPFRKPGSTQFDHLKVTNRPFQIARNGYAILARGGREQQVFGSTEKETEFAQEDRRMKRGSRIKGETEAAAGIPKVMSAIVAVLLSCILFCNSASAQQFLFFTQPGCGPCEQMKKNVLPGLTKAGFKFEERDARTDPLAAQLDFKTTPTFVAVDNAGKATGMIVGATTADALRRIAVKPVAIEKPIVAPAEAIDRETIKVELGRKLFFDSRLSKDNTTSCSSCHNPALGYSDGRPVAIGLIGPGSSGLLGVRNSPTVLSVGKQVRQFWDGRAANLEEQALGPIANPAEMGNQTVGQVVQRLRGIPGYRTLFGQAFGHDVNQQDFGSALAAFERTLVATNAPIDRYLAGDAEALSEPAERGYQVAVRSRCFDCHQTANDFRGTFANNGYSARTSLKDAGLSAAVINGQTVGRGHNNQNLRAFKVPTLRELPLTGPYMHDGGLRTLADVVAHYAGGGRFNSNGQLARDAVIDPRVAAINLSTDQQRDLLAFLSEAFTGDYPRVYAPAVFP